MFLRANSQLSLGFCEPIVSSLWFAQKITLCVGDSCSPRKVQLTLSLDSLCDEAYKVKKSALQKVAHKTLR
jgi:hypothetical protein